MKIGSKINIKKADLYYQKSWSVSALSKAHTTPKLHLIKSLDKPINKAILPTSNQKMVAEKHNFEQLLHF